MNDSTHSKRRQWGEHPVQISGDGEPIVRVSNLRSPFFYRDLHRYISRYWKCHMNASEYSTLDMIFDRTIGWGKLWEWISLQHFVTGIWNEKQVYSDGTGLSKRTVQRAIMTLESKGMILKRDCFGQCSKFALNLLWKPPSMRYVNGKKAFHPLGSEEYWNKSAEGKAAETWVLIQRGGADLYEYHYDSGKQPEEE